MSATIGYVTLNLIASDADRPPVVERWRAIFSCDSIIKTNLGRDTIVSSLDLENVSLNVATVSYFPWQLGSNLPCRSRGCFSHWPAQSPDTPIMTHCNRPTVL